MFFWAKPADSPEWEEIPATGGLLVAGTYNIAVQSPQPHFTIVSQLRQYRRQDDDTETLHWQAENSSRTNGEGVGWIVQDLELTAGRWQISCRDADLVAELFGENSDNSVTFQVIDLKGARLSSGPYDSSGVSLPAMAPHATSSVTPVATPHLKEQPAGSDTYSNPPTVPPVNSSHEVLQSSQTGLKGSYSHGNDVVAPHSSSDADRSMPHAPDREDTGHLYSGDWQDGDCPSQSASASHQPFAQPSSQSQNPQSSNPQSLNPDDVVTEIFSPAMPSDSEFALNRSEFTAFPGETIDISGYSRRAGQLTVTALTKNSAPIQENQRLTIPSSGSHATFSVHLQVPSSWSEDAIVGVAELHPDDGSASLSQDFTVSAEPRYSRASTPSAVQPKIDSWQADNLQVVSAPEDILSNEHLPTDVDRAEAAQPEVAQAVIPPANLEDGDNTLASPANVESLPNAQLTKTAPRPTNNQAETWKPELTDEDILPPDIAFASSRSPDRTLHRLMALVQSSMAATAARTRFQQAQSATPTIIDGAIDGIVGDVKVVPTTEVPIGAVLPSDSSRLGWERSSITDRLESDRHAPGRPDRVAPPGPIEPSNFNTSDDDTPSPIATLAVHNRLAIDGDSSPAVDPNASRPVDSPASIAEITTQPLSEVRDDAASNRSVPVAAIDEPASNSTADNQTPLDTVSGSEREPSTEAETLPDSRASDDSSSPDCTKSSALSIDIPQSLRSGDLVSVVMKSKANPHPACVKLWVINSANQTVVDGPRWILDFSADGDIRTGITHLTVPSRVQSLQFQACAYPSVPSDIEDADGVVPVATVTVHRSVAPRTMPYR